MERYSEIKRPGLIVLLCDAIGRRLFGRVPTPQRIMARGLPLMAGLGALYGAIRWLGVIDPQLRSLLNVQVAQLSNSDY
jgi:hypothetical protein